MAPHWGGGSFHWQLEGWLGSLWNSKPSQGNRQHEQSWDSGWTQMLIHPLAMIVSREPKEAIQGEL